MKRFLLGLFLLMTPLFGQCPKVVILLGAPGAGKGTQAVLLKEKMGVPHIASGDLLRENLKNQTELGKSAKGFMDRGELVPDDLILDMLQERLKHDDANKGFILDGVPRTTAQAEAIDKMIGKKFEVVAISLEVPDTIILERLAGRYICEKCQTPYHVSNMPSQCERCGGKLIQRKDDTAEVIKKRLEVYHKQAEPIKSYYKAGNRLVLVDGTMPKDNIAQAMLSAVSCSKE